MSQSARPGSRLRYVLAAVIAAVLMAVALYVAVPQLRSRPAAVGPSSSAANARCPGMASGATVTGTGECVGVVDRSSALAPQVGDVVDRILTANAKVAAGSTPYVRVALLTPLTVAPSGASAISLDQIRFSLEGSFAALNRINNGNDFGSPNAVAIQLILVNQGSRQEQSEALIKQILDLGVPNHPLVAVVGLGSSFPGVEATAAALSGQGIPMVSAVASADSLTMQRYKTLRSVSPSNRDYADALRAFLTDPQTGLHLHNGIIVQDTNNDPYPSTLRDDFHTMLAPYIKFPEQPFTGGTIESRATKNVFAPDVTNICNAVNDRNTPLDTVFFAGRVADFEPFADALSSRTCLDTPLVVMVGATGFQAAEKYANTLANANVMVLYASSADAPGWARNVNGTPEGFAGFLKEFSRDFTDVDNSLTDGYAIMYHDALATAAKATRIAAQGTTIPTAADVNVQLGALSLSNVVRGASGTLELSDRPDGRARGKLVVYRQIGSIANYHLPGNIAPYLTQ
jgi:hypothetical protein